MDKESPLKIDVCSQLISRIIGAEATYEAGAIWGAPWLS